MPHLLEDKINIKLNNGTSFIKFSNQISNPVLYRFAYEPVIVIRSTTNKKLKPGIFFATGIKLSRKL